MAKMKTITLASGYHGSMINEPKQYKVLQITDSTAYLPGDQLTKKMVDSLCEAKDWKVTIKPKDI